MQKILEYTKIAYSLGFVKLIQRRVCIWIKKWVKNRKFDMTIVNY